VSIKLPKEILSEEKFLELANFAIHCRVKRVKDVVKLKLRTRKYLYTYKTDPNSADRLLSSISCDVIEL
jgi:large subunit ribosomal protein L38e